ncbi:MAG: phage holin family protein [Anaerolineae bacterium]
MINLLVRWVIVSLALFVAARLLPGFKVEGTAWIAYAVMAAILGLVNALVRPILKILTCPLIVLTMGLFTLVVNGLTFLLAARLSNVIARGLALDVAFSVNGFGWAFLGALIVSVVTVLVSALVSE